MGQNLGTPMTTRLEPAKVLQLRVTLNDFEPLIWRQVLVPSTIHMGQLHDVIQCAMGWTDSHFHEFEIRGRLYGMPMPEFEGLGNPVFHERSVKLEELLKRAGERFSYIYDMGDDWRHEIIVEDILAAADDRPGAKCIGGEGCCPPEDVGGVFGYAEFLDAIADPSHEDHEHYLDWIGGDFDPGAFDIEKVNVTLANLARR